VRRSVGWQHCPDWRAESFSAYRVYGWCCLWYSTDTGDAWLLDVADQLAAPLARDGDPEPIHLEETATRFAIGWKGHYRIEGTAFIYADRDSGRVRTILGYPIHKIARAS
jgi:hypothetical protein